MTDDEREALADRLARRLIDDPKQLMLAEGTGALHVALSDSIRSVIEDVYADCGDSDPGVLSSNIARRLAWDLPPAIHAAAGFRRSEVPEPRADDSMSHYADPTDPFWQSAPEPQGEPSDALPLWERPEAIEAARLAYQGAYEADYDAEDCIAFALRAAGEAQ